MNELRNSNVLRLFIKLLPVQILLAVASGLSGVINGLIIGNFYSVSAMSALGLVTPMIGFLSSLASIVSGGLGIVSGLFMGSGETKKLNTAFSNAIITLVCSGIVITIFVNVFANNLAILFGASAETINNTVTYIRSISIGITPLIILPSMMTFLQMNNKSFISLFSTVLLAILNASFDLINVMYIKAGIAGIGLASALSNYITLLFVIIYFIIHKNIANFSIKEFDPKMIGKILMYGFPASLAGILYSTRNIFINKAAFLVGGDNAVNALAILGSCGIFFDAFNIGLSTTLAMLVSVFIGERNSTSLKTVFKVDLCFIILFSVFKLIVGYGFGDSIAKLFGARENVIPLCHQLIIYYCWSAPLNFINQIFISVYQSLGRVKTCSVIYLFNCLLIPIFSCFVLSKFFGIEAVWFCYTLPEIITFLVIILVGIIKKKGPITSIDDLLFLGKDFDTSNKISISITQVDEAVNIAKSIEDLCLEKGIDARRSRLAGLCIEHGFIKDDIENSLDIFAVVENDEITLKLRDNCIPFDPQTKLQMYTDDPEKNIGIKMVSKIAKKMSYQTTFGLNVLTIKL